MGTKRRTLRTRLVVAFALLALATTTVTVLLSWGRARAARLETLRSLLVATATTGVAAVDADAFARLDLASPAVGAEPAWTTVKTLAARVKASHPAFREVFLLRVPDDGNLANSWMVVADRRQQVGTRYDASRFPAMREAAAGTPGADEEITPDEYGATLSGYAPIRDSRGRPVGILGVDIDASTIQAMWRDALGILARIAAVATVVGAALGWFFARRISRPVSEIALAMDRVEAGDLSARVAAQPDDEVGRLAGQFNRMAEGLEERQRLKQSLLLAMEVQQKLLPAGPPTVPGLDVAGFSDYCDETGGDYFDYPRTWEVPGGRLALTMGDVTGHGIGAALLMSTGRAILRAACEGDASPSAVVGVVNRHLARDATHGRFMTLFFGVLDPAAGTLRYANAGQGGCLVVRAAGGAAEWLSAGGPPLAVVDGVEYPETVTTGLSTGDVVVLASDGIYETFDPEGTPFGYERLEEVVRRHVAATAADLAKAVTAAVLAFRRDGPQTDDVTLVVARVVGAPAGQT
ncbi:MAG TPA: SpoIIE family protein phosphatase [Planctomycetota bacterium]|nr:SpoIIE family protein phosphatase [Planctomycetota bacterium]